MKTKIAHFIDTHPYVFGASVLAILTLIIYGNVVFGPSNIVLSRSDLDLARAFTNFHFSISQILQGHFPLWNPNLMGGYPWFASFQSMMLYPPAVIFLMLPLGTAINAFLAFHVFLIGFGAFCWLKQKELHPLSCVLAGAILMFCSQVTLQIYAGEVTPVATMPWVLFLFLATDGCFIAKYRLRWILAGTAFVALQIMAGFPQHVYYTALLIGIYALAKVFFIQTERWTERLKVLLSIAVMYVWGAAICTVQLWTAFDAATETSRHGKLPFNFAGSHSFPPAQLITLIAPQFFGNMRSFYYWGMNTVWESIFYVGLSALVLALAGIIYGKHKERFILFGLTLLTLLIGLGYYTPFYTLLYHYVPGFGSFRANFRILFQCSIFITALAAMGFDRLLKDGRKDLVSKPLSYVSLLLAIVLGSAGVATYLQELPGKLNWFRNFMYAISHLPFLRMEPAFYTDSASIQTIAQTLSIQFALGAITAILITLLLIYQSRNKRALYYLGALAIVEVMLFTASMRPTFDINTTFNKRYRTFLNNHPGDLRFVEHRLDNFANGLPEGLSGGDIHGYDSLRLERYEAFMQFSQRITPELAPTFIWVTKPSPLFALLRGKYFFDDGKIQVMPGDALPHLLLVAQWKVVDGSKKVLSLLNKTGFNPRHTALLESTPIFPQSSKTSVKSAQVELAGESTNWLDIKATTSKNTILLVTDTYAKDWKIFPYADSSQQKYDVMPADYILRGIPLSPGTHHFRLQYIPAAFDIGKLISLLTLFIYLLAIPVVFLNRGNE